MYEKFKKEKVQSIIMYENILMMYKDETINLEDKIILWQKNIKDYSLSVKVINLNSVNESNIFNLLFK